MTSVFESFPRPGNTHTAVLASQGQRAAVPTSWGEVGGRPYIAPTQLPAQGIAFGAVQLATEPEQRLWGCRRIHISAVARFIFNIRATLRALLAT